MGIRTLAVVSLAALAAACVAPDVNGSNLDQAPASGQGDDDDSSSSQAKSPSGTGSSSSTSGTSPGGVTPPQPTQKATNTAPPSGPDSDKDGIPDSVDCAPNDATIAGAQLLRDDLATDGGFFTPATGFPLGDWTYAAAYTQTRLADAPDQTLFNKDAAITDAIVSVTAASTEVSSGITPMLRQMFITFQTTMTAGTLSAVGCGLEVDQNASPTQQTSIVRLTGDASHVTSTPINRVARGAVQAGELFQMKGTLKNGLLTCEVTIGGTTTTTAQGSVGAATGGIGFFTNQTKALFKTASICKLK